MLLGTPSVPEEPTMIKQMRELSESLDELAKQIDQHLEPGAMIVNPDPEPGQLRMWLEDLRSLKDDHGDPWKPEIKLTLVQLVEFLEQWET
tara:strand:+ start:325 stop:597 length:273 start_codon:yes stop_codon:yes gene_type:complete